MAIVNRDLDNSQKKVEFNWQGTAATSGGTYQLALVPYQCEVEKIEIAGIGLSGSPSVEVEAYKFSGGITVNSDLSSALSVTAWGTSGAQSLTLGTAGSTQVLLDANSKLVVRVTGANSAVNDLAVSVVARKLQDIVTHFE